MHKKKGPSNQVTAARNVEALEIMRRICGLGYLVLAVALPSHLILSYPFCLLEIRGNFGRLREKLLVSNVKEEEYWRRTSCLGLTTTKQTFED